MTLATEEPTVQTPTAPLPTKISSYKGKSKIWSGFSDVWSGLKRMDLWLNLSWEDLNKNYYRSKLGLIWAPAAFAVRIAVYVMIFWRLIDTGNFEMIICYIALGFIIWEVVSSGLTNGLTLFASNSGWIKSSTLPFSVFTFQNTTTLMFRFCLNLIVVIIALIVFRKGLAEQLHWYNFVFSFFGLIALIANLIWVQVFLGIVCARFRDVQHFVNSITRILFILSPVLWRPSRLGDYAEIIHLLNPIAHTIAVFREPILHGQLPVVSWMVVISMIIVGHFSTWILLGLTKKKLAFWI